MTRSQRDGRQRMATPGQAPEPRRGPSGRPQQHTSCGGRPDDRLDGRRTSGEPLSASWDPAAKSQGRRARPPTEPGVRGFVRTYGWRIYALPVLLVLTALAVLNVDRFPLPAPNLSGPPQAAIASPVTPPVPSTSEAPPTPLVPNPDTAKFAEAKVSAELPVGGPFTETGPGTWVVVPGSGPPIGAGEMFTYSVELESGVVLPGGPEGLAQIVDTTLANPKSWIGSGKYAFQRVDGGAPDIRVTLASQQTARQLCGFRIPFDASCWRGGRVVLSTARWERGAVAFQGNVVAYQQYVVNHEVGHALGFGHKPCAEQGALAPIMMQQTWGLSNDYLAALGTDNIIADGKTCAPNPWPYPTPG
jgi:Protein of unknown function (DUF3152)